MKQNAAKLPFVREWGSWVVFGTSCIVALITGLLMHPAESGRGSALTTVLTISGMFFLINSKNPLGAVIRTKGENRVHMAWFLFFSIAGMLCLIPFLISGTRHFAVFLLPVITYVLMMRSGREHHILAEINGFALLTLSAPVVYFVVTGEVSLRLYAAVLLFFAAGVFKVRVRLRKTVFFRITMILHCIVSLAVFHVMEVHVIILLPMAENIVSAIWMREEKLRTTGNIELAKSIIFAVLMGLFWR